MVYVFEGSRNSGKTYLSNHISRKFNIPRFQFDFVNGFNLLGLESKYNREAHTFCMGKELMIMQLSKDLQKSIPDFIHDRGILTVLSWGLLEKRISEKEAIDQIKYVKDKNLLDNCIIVNIEGDNPDKSRIKDQWDDSDNKIERECLDFIISKFKESGIHKIHGFVNKFNPESISNIESLFENILFY